MPFQTIESNEFLAAYIAFDWPFRLVCTHMQLNCLLRWECIVANLTYECGWNVSKQTALKNPYRRAVADRLLFFVVFASSWVFSCLFSFCTDGKESLHTLQTWSLLRCVNLMCCSKRDFRLNDMSHWSQLKPFSPVWLNMCDRNCVAWMKLFWHISQTCGRTPVWILLWRLSVSFAEKHLWHCEWIENVCW